MRGPQVGEGTEIYLVPTVETGATATEEHGLEAGIPEPVATNRTAAMTMGVIGTIRDNQDDVFPVTIRSTDIGVYTREAGFFNGNILIDFPNTSVSDWVKKIKEWLRASKRSVPVSRFNVTHNGITYEIDPDFRRYPYPSSQRQIAVPSGYAIDQYAQAAWLADTNGNLYLFYLAQSAGKYKIFAYKIHQKYGPTSYFGNDVQAEDNEYGSSNFLENELYAGVAGEIVNPSLAAFMYQGDIYIAVANGGTVAAPIGELGFFSLRTATGIATGDRIKYVSGPIRTQGDMETTIDGGITAVGTENSVVVAVGAIQNPTSSTKRRGVLLGRSTDMRNWNDNEGDQVPFYDLDSFESLIELDNGSEGDDRMYFADIHFSADGEHGWAVTNTGEIWHSSDRGRSWAKQKSPCETPGIALTRIFVAGGTPEEQGDEFTVYAIGSRSTILRTTNSGETWHAMCSALSDEIESSFWTDGGQAKGDAFISGKRNAPGIGDTVLNGLYFSTETTGYIVGNSNTVIKVNNGKGALQLEGNDWQIIQIPRTELAAKFHDVSTTGTGTSLRVLICGEIHKNTDPRGSYAIIQSTMDDLENPANGWSYLPFSDERSILLRAYKFDDNTSYFCGTRGSVVVYRGGSVTQILPAPSRGETLEDIHVSAITSIVHQIYTVSRSGLVIRGEYNTTTGGVAWIGKKINSSRSGSTSIHCNTNEIFIGAGKTIWFTDDSLDNRVYPSMVICQNGSVSLVCCNLDSSMIEKWLSSDFGFSFSRVEDQNDASLKCGSVSSSKIFTIDDSEWGSVSRPSLTVADNGDVLLVAGEDGLVSRNNGLEWAANDNLNLPIPLGTIQLTTPDAADGIVPTNRTVTIAAYGGMRIFLAILDNAAPYRYSIYTAREWRAESPSYLPPPVILGKPQWIGLDDLHIIFSGDPALDDSWSIPARFRYTVANIHKESPSIFYRSDDDIGQVILEWDAGPSKVFKISAMALFGSNFRHAQLQFSVPGYDGSVFPTTTDNITKFNLSADIESGVVTNIHPGLDLPVGGNVIVDSSKCWIPGQYAPGARTYYVQVLSPNTNDALPFKILDNSKDSLIVDVAGRGQALTVLYSQNKPYVIYGDRMVTTGETAWRNEQATGPVIDTLYQFTRFVRLFIPASTFDASTFAHRTSDGYFKIGTALLGVHIPVIVKRPSGDERRYRFSRGFRWQSVVNTVVETSISGISNVEHFGNLGQIWTLTFDNIDEWQQDIFMAGIGDRLRRAFGMIFDGNTPSTIELVRLEDAPESSNVAGQQYTVTFALREVK